MIYENVESSKDRIDNGFKLLNEANKLLEPNKEK